MRVLLVSSRFPLPPWRGNQLRTLQWLDALTDHDVTLACPAAGGTTDGVLVTEIVPLPRGRAATIWGGASALVGGRPVQEGFYDTVGSRQRLRSLLQRWAPDVVVIQMVRCAWAADLAAECAPQAALIFDAIDCMALHFGRTASTAPAHLAPLYRLEARRCRRRESELVSRASLTVAVSGRDLDALDAAERGRVVTVAAGVEAVAVDDPERPPVVLLSGNLGYAPTVRAACTFARTAWPEIRRSVPEARWMLAGARPAAAVRELADLDGVEVHGDVAEMAPFFGRAAVALAPMSGGSGVPIKILEALAARVPVVADPWSAAGLEDPTVVVVADSPDDWVRAVCELLMDRSKADVQRARGFRIWRDTYHPDVVRRSIRDAVELAE